MYKLAAVLHSKAPFSTNYAKPPRQQLSASVSNLTGSKGTRLWIQTPSYGGSRGDGCDFTQKQLFLSSPFQTAALKQYLEKHLDEKY